MAELIDITKASAFQGDIHWVADRGYLTGWSDRTFRPLSKIKRDEMAAVFYRMAGAPDFAPPARSPFRDVSPNQQFYREICWAKDRGLLTGWSNGTFRPFNDITRDASCALFYRAAGSPAYSRPGRSPFKDVRPDRQFYKEICWARSVGITTGWPDGTFRPSRPTDRNAMAAFIKRFDLAVG